jgi:hypothetical protein
MNVSAPPTVNSDQTKAYHRAHLVITNQPHLQQQQLIQQHLQQKQQYLQQQQQQRQNYNDKITSKEEGSSSSSSRKTSASSFFAAIRPRSKSDSVRRKSDKLQNHLLLSDRVI